jgi:hypothetical protein
MFHDPGKMPTRLPFPFVLPTPVTPPLAATTATSHGMAVDHTWLVTTIKWVTQKPLLLYMEGWRDRIVNKIYQVHTWQSSDCLRASQTIINIFTVMCGVYVNKKTWLKSKAIFLGYWIFKHSVIVVILFFLLTTSPTEYIPRLTFRRHEGLM